MYVQWYMKGLLFGDRFLLYVGYTYRQGVFLLSHSKTSDV